MGHTCSECHSTFKHFRSLIGHKKTHKTHEIKTYKCQQCPSSFTRRDNLQRHISDHHPIPPPTKKIRKIEPEPSKPTTRPSVIVANSNPHPPPQPFKRPWQDVQPPPPPLKRPWEDTQPSTPIDEPSRVVPNPLYAPPPSPVAGPSNPVAQANGSVLNPFYASPPSPVAGPSGVARTPFQCQRCTRHFYNQANLNRHLREIHGGVKRYKCETCPFSTNNLLALESHEKHKNCMKQRKPKGKINTIYDDESSHISAFDNKVYRRGIPLKGETDPLEVLKNNRDKIREHISNALQVKGSISTQIHLHMKLKKTDKDGETTTSTPSFNSTNRRVLNLGEFDDMYQEATNKILESYGNHVKEGSGWQIDKVINLNLLVSEYYPIRVGKYIPTPQSITHKNAILNIQNGEGTMCFKWSILAALHSQSLEPGQDPKLVSTWTPWENTLNFYGIEFPMAIEDISKFEKQNSIYVNVYHIPQEGGQILPLRITKNRDQDPINLLVIEGLDESNHYTWIHQFDVLLQYDYTNSKWFCPYCMHGFTKRYCSLQKFHEHHENIYKYGPQKVKYLEEGSNTLQFNATDKENPVKYLIYCDFETILPHVDGCEPNPNDSSTTRKNHHLACGYSYVVIGPDDPPRHVTYKGEDAGPYFLRAMLEEERKIIEACGKEMSLTTEEQQHFDETSECHICKGPITHKDPKGKKVRDHCHYAGKFRGAAHNICNLRYKDSKKNPVFFHNLSGYDGHIIFQSLSEVEGIQTPQVLAKTMEKYLSFTIGSLHFNDSLQFLNSSLDKLVQNALGKEKDYSIMKNLCQYFYDKWSNLDEEAFIMLTRKGVYPYSYMDSFARFEETSLPPREAFFNDLTNQHITDEDYDFIHKLWKKFELKNLGELHNLYVETDVYLLADVFEGYRKCSLENYGLDPAHFLTAPGLSWMAALKYTGVVLTIPTDPDMHHFFDKGLRGGISMVANQFGRANHAGVTDYDEDLPTSHIQYVDCNNLYGKAMMAYLPTGDFEWIPMNVPRSAEFWTEFILSQKDEQETGYMFEVDLHYPPHLHDAHDNYPLAPEHVNITEEMLSQHQRKLAEELGVKLGGKKLCTTLQDKKKYVCHYRSLKKYIELGLVITKVHRVLQFEQSPWLKPYIELNTRLRIEASTNFGVSLAKLMNNAFFGKTCEDVRKYKHIVLCNTAEGADKRLRKNNVKGIKIFDEHLIAVEHTKDVVTLNKPRYIGN